MYTAHTFNKDAFTMTEITEEKKSHAEEQWFCIYISFICIMFSVWYQFLLISFSICCFVSGSPKHYITTGAAQLQNLTLWSFLKISQTKLLQWWHSDWSWVQLHHLAWAWSLRVLSVLSFLAVLTNLVKLTWDFLLCGFVITQHYARFLKKVF